jgi:exonuclease III
LALSETFAQSDQPSILDPIAGYASWSTNRGGSEKGRGGLTILYKDTLTAHKYTPAVPANLKYIQNERQCLLVIQAKDRCAFLHVYIACQNSSDSFLKWNEDLFFLIKEEAIKLKQQGFMVLAMGDFNSRVGCLKGLSHAWIIKTLQSIQSGITLTSMSL